MCYSRTFLQPGKNVSNASTSIYILFVLTALRLSEQTSMHVLRARIYSARGAKPLTTNVPYTSSKSVMNAEVRFVVPEACFDDAVRQSYVHGTVVRCRFRGRRYSFKLFYKNHVSLPLNRALPELLREGMRGDVLAVAYGSKVGERSLTGLETSAADCMIRR